MSEVGDDASHRIRRPSRDDLPRLHALAAEIWPNRSPDRLADRWWWSGEEPQCWLAEHVATGDVAAICAERRVRFSIGDTVREAASTSDWYVSPRFAGEGLGRRLVTHTALPFRYTTAISEAAGTAFGRLGWSGPNRSAIFLGPTRASGRRSVGAGLSFDRRVVSSGASTFEDVDEVWQALHWDDRAMMVRDGAQLRRHLALVPGRSYELTVVSRGGRPVGYALHRCLPAGSLRLAGPLRVGVLADYLVSREDTEALRGLVGDVAAALRAEGASVLMSVVNESSHQRAFWRMGYVSRGPMRRGPLARKLSMGWMHTSEVPVPDTARWHLTLVDNDTDLILGQDAEVRGRS